MQLPQEEKSMLTKKLAFLLALPTLVLAAPNAICTEFSLGPIMGFSNAALRDTTGTIVDRTIVVAGLSSELSFTEHMAAGMDLMYGKRIGGADLHLLEIPLTIQVRAKKDKLSISGGLGPYLGIVLSRKSVDDAAPLDCGGVITASVEYEIGSGEILFVKASYQRGFADLDRKVPNEAFTNNTMMLFGTRIGL